MSADRNRAARVGTLVVVAGLVLAAFILSLSSKMGPFAGRANYHSRFVSTQGLSPGAEVRYLGVTVGEVKSVELSPDPGSTDVIVSFVVRKALAPRIDAAVVAEIRSTGALGDKLLDLRRDDSPPGVPLRAGSEIPGKAPLDLSGLGGDLFNDLQSIAGSLDTITSRLVAGDGVMGRLLKDREYGDRVLGDIEQVLDQFRGIVERSENGRNLLGTLLADEALASEVRRSVLQSLSSMEIISRRIEDGEGALGQLTRADSELSRALEDMTVAAANFREVSERLASSRGLIYRLTADPDYGDAVAADIRATLAHARSIAAKIDEGQGSAGLLLNDPAIYSGLSHVVRGVNKSWLVSTILKKKQMRGYEARVDEILATSEDPDAELVRLLESVLSEEQAPAARQRGAP
jgi:phospholipid/cholesterol/gamma-HCH transport system substrate-binding protein